MLLNGVVHTLDEHVFEPRPLQDVGHGGGIAERVDRPATLWSDTWRYIEEMDDEKVDNGDDMRMMTMMKIFHLYTYIQTLS